MASIGVEVAALMGRIPQAMRFISIKFSGETLSEVMMLLREPHPKVNVGESALRDLARRERRGVDNHARNGHFLAEGYGRPARTGMYSSCVITRTLLGPAPKVDSQKSTPRAQHQHRP